MISAPPISNEPAVDGLNPAITSANSRWPLPATPAMPTISPALTRKVRLEKASSPRSPRALKPSSSSKGTPGVLGSGLSVAPAEVPTINWASSRWSVDSRGRALATVFPCRSTVASSQMPETSCNLWLIKMMDLPSSAIFVKISPSSSTSLGVSTVVGSSRINTCALRQRIFKISTFWRSPIDSCQSGCEGSTLSPKRSASSETSNSTCLIRSTLSADPRITFSATEKDGINRNSWWTIPIPALRASAGLRNC